MQERLIVNPELYSREYFLNDNEGYAELAKGLDDYMHDKFVKALKWGNPQKGYNILDLGCGRGELVYYCAKKGAKVLGIDYSKDGIAIARETINKLPHDFRKLAQVEVGDISTYEFKDKYDLIFMIEVAEHMYNYQLEDAFKRIESLLKDNGRLIIMTPNYYYERLLSPLKRISNIPINLIKYPLRVVKGKYIKGGAWIGFKKIFRIIPDRGQLNRMMHVNITTPQTLKKLLYNFNAQIECIDPSINPLSILTKKWFGREIVVVASKK